MRAWNYLSTGLASFSLPTNIQKRLYKFLLRRAIGQFLANELDLENFDIELVNGSVELRDLDLNLQALNECTADTAFTLERGHVASISASLPWANFWSGNIALRVHGLRLTLRPVREKPKRRPSSSDGEDSPIMSSSLHFADDFLRSEIEPDQNQELYESIQQSFHPMDDPESPTMEHNVDVGAEGLQILTRVIEKMLAKIRVDVTDTVVRIAHKPAAAGAESGLSQECYLDLHIPRISYFDETPEFNNAQTPPTTTNMAESSVFLPPVANETIKIISVESPIITFSTGVGNQMLYTQPTPSETTLATAGEATGSDAGDTPLSQTEFFEAQEEILPSLESSAMSGSITPRGFPPLRSSPPLSPRAAPSLLVSAMDKDNWIRIKWRHASPFDEDNLPSGSSSLKQLDIMLTHLRVILTPTQTVFLLDMLQAMNSEQPAAFTSSPDKSAAGESSSAPSLGTTGLKSLPEPIKHTPDKLPSSSKHSFTPSSGVTPPPTRHVAPQPDSKIKLQLSKLEIFMLYNDTAVPLGDAWTSEKASASKDMSHLKVFGEQIIVRLQDFSSSTTENKDTNRARYSPSQRPSPSSYSQSFPSIDTSSSTASLRSISSNPLLRTLDVRIANAMISEYLKQPSCLQSPRLSDSVFITTPYDMYNPILEFDYRIRNDYTDDDIFPSIPWPPTLENNKVTDRVDAVRIRIDRRLASAPNRSSNDSFYEETNADIQPLKLHIDARIADRLENYVMAILRQTTTPVSSGPTEQSRSDIHNMSPQANQDWNRESDRFVGQKVYDDLDRLSTDVQDHNNKCRVRFALIRLYLHVPDMSQVSVRDEWSDRIHADILSADLKKVVITWTSKNNALAGLEHDSEPSSAHPAYYPSIHSLDAATTPTPIIANAEVKQINVFMRQAHENVSRCWFVARPLQKPGGRLFETDTQSLTVDIVFRPQGGKPTRNPQTSYFGSGLDIPGNLLDYLERNESFDSNQKLHVPAEARAESTKTFKQHTMETSLFSVHCQFPETRMNLSKSVWDCVQILQNDITLWQPRFMNALSSPPLSPEAPDLPKSPGSTASFMSDTPKTFIDARTGHSEKSFVPDQSQYAEGTTPRLEQPSLFSLLVVMGEAIWDLSIADAQGTTHAYHLSMQEFRYFVAVRHAGLNENITALDIDDLTLFDNTHQDSKTALLYRTLPKNMTPKRNTTMVSLLSRLTTLPFENKQEKTTSVTACNICWKFSLDTQFVDHLVSFQKVPDEMVYIDPPTQQIKVYVYAHDLSIDYQPTKSPSRAAVVFDGLQVSTSIIANQPILGINIFLQSIDMFLIDDVAEQTSQQLEYIESKTMDAKRYWTLLGLPCVLSISSIEALAKIKTGDVTAPDVDIALLSSNICIECCADSFQSLVNIVTYFANDGDNVSAQQDNASHKTSAKQKSNKTRSPVTVYTGKEDIFASVVEDAFRSPVEEPQDTSPRSRLSLPTDLRLMESFYSNHNMSSSGIQGPPPKPRRQHQTKSTDHIIRVLVPEKDHLELIEDTFLVDETPKSPPMKTPTSNSGFVLHASHCNFTWKLLEGYDFAYVRHGLSTFYNAPRSSHSSTGDTRSSDLVDVHSPLSDPGISLAREEHLGWAHTNTTTSPYPTLPIRDNGSFQSSSSGERSPKSPQDPSREQSRLSVSERQRLLKSLRRSSKPILEIKLDGIHLHLILPRPGEHLAFDASLDIDDVTIVDHIETSVWKTFLGYMHPDSTSLPREQGSVMVSVNVAGTQPAQNDPTPEIRLSVKLLPCRIFADQDALNFLVHYFTFDKAILRSTLPTNIILATKLAGNDDESTLFFQQVDIHPIVLKVDYKPKCINYGNLKEGQLAELVNLFRLDGADLTLSRVQLTGISGTDGLVNRLLQEWLPHIKNTQVPNMISGVSPIRSIVNLGSGVADLVLLPIQQYRKDGRIIKGIQRGTQSFARATAVEAIKLTSRVASGTQVILEHADEMFARRTTPSTSNDTSSDVQYVYVEENPDMSSLTGESSSQPAQRRRSSTHPNDLSQGLQDAFHNLSKNLGSAAQTVFAIPTDIRDRDGTAKAVIKAVPVAVIKPMIGLTSAFQSILMGLRSSIDPARRLQNAEHRK